MAVSAAPKAAKNLEGTDEDRKNHIHDSRKPVHTRNFTLSSAPNHRAFTPIPYGIHSMSRQTRLQRRTCRRFARRTLSKYPAATHLVGRVLRVCRPNGTN